MAGLPCVFICADGVMRSNVYSVGESFIIGPIFFASVGQKLMEAAVEEREGDAWAFVCIHTCACVYTHTHSYWVLLHALLAYRDRNDILHCHREKQISSSFGISQ